MRLHSLMPLLAAAATALAAPLAACSTDGQRAMGSYVGQVERLRAECTARGGELQPTGRMSSNAAADNPCVVR